MSEPLKRPCPLSRAHDLGPFDCGSPALDEYLRRYARQNQERDAARTYVSTRGARVVGYYTLAYGAVDRESTPLRIHKSLARHPVPVIVLARLAVDRSEQGRGLGKSLLRDALQRTLSAADIAGLRAVLVHAKDDVAAAWYRRCGFEASPVDELHLYLLMQDIRHMLASD